jgi:hypothetical protein
MAIEHIIDPDLANDADYLAYVEARDSGKFDGLEPGTFVAFVKGVLFTTAASFDELFQQEKMKDLTDDAFIHEVNVPEQIYPFWSPRLIRK